MTDALVAPSISLDPAVSLDAHGGIALSGSVVGTSGVGQVDITALVDGYERRLGTAIVDSDGRFTFIDRTLGHFQASVTVSATDAAGRTLSAQAPFTLQGPYGPTGHKVWEQDTYSADGSVLLRATRLFRDGSRFVQVETSDQTVSAGGSEGFDIRGARDTTLAFADGSGRDVVFGFRASGPGHDTIDLSDAGIANAQDLLSRITMRNGHAVIHLPSGEAIVLEGVTKAQIARHLDDFEFAGQSPQPEPTPVPPGSGPTPSPPSPQPSPSPSPQPSPSPEPSPSNHPPTITVTDPAPVDDAAPGTPTPVTVRIADAVTISDPDPGDKPVPYAGGLGLQSTTGPAPASGSVAGLFSIDAADGTISYDRSAFAYLSQGQKVTATFGFESASGPDTLPESLTVEVDGTDQLPTVAVTNPAPTLATTTSAPAPVTVDVASAVTVSDPDAADAATPYASGLALQSTTGPAPASGDLTSLFTVDPSAGTVTYDRSAFAYLLKGQSVTAKFGFETTSGPDTLPEAITVEIDGANVPSATPAFHLAPTDASASDARATTASTVTLVGSGTPGDTVALSGSTATDAPTTVVAADGTFRFVNVGLGSGDNALSASASHYGTPPATASATVTRDGSATSDNAATVWNRLALAAIASSAVDPEIASRALAMESLAVYNAVSAIDGTPGFLFNAAAPAGASAEAAVARAAHDVLVAEFPSQKATLDAALATSLGAILDGTAKSEGVALGASVAATVIALRANDGATATLTDTGQDGLDQWQPTAPMYAPGEEPQWAFLTPFTLTSGSQFVAPAPPALDSQEYADAYNETKSLGANDSTTRTADETQIAKFWSDGTGTYTPPGAWDEIADDAATNTSAGLSQTARTMALLNIAQADSAIATWNTKYTYNTWRPIEAIADGDIDGNPDTAAQAGWTPLITTPSHPEYVSGHSTFSSAAADILDAVYGTNYGFSTTSSSLANTTRSYTSFDQAAAEAGMSRIYGGIHFQFSVDAGAALGQQVGDWVLQYFDNSTDTQGPAIALDQTPGLVTAGNLTVTGHATDNLSGVASLRYALDDGGFATATVAADGSFAVPLTAALASAADGLHTLDLVALDAAGNASALDTFAFSLAKAAPTIALSTAGVHDGETVSSGEHLVGRVTLPVGDALTALSYGFDGQAASTVPMAFTVSPGATSFDDAVDFGKLAAGQHSLTLTATDAAGRTVTDTIGITVPTLPLTVVSLTPAPMSMDVGVTYRPEIRFSRAIDTSTLTSDSFYATDTTGATIAATIVPLADGTGAFLLFKSPLPGGSNVTLHVDGGLIHAADGTELDAAGTGTPGSNLADTFSTVASAGVPGTTISGIVVDPGPDNQPMTPDDVKGGPNGLLDYAHDTWKLPIAGAKVYILGHEDEAVYTDSTGHFQLTDVPAGDVKVVIDGRTATNSPSGVFFPEMVMDSNIKPGVDNTLMGSMGSVTEQETDASDPATYLPRIPSGTLTPVSPVAPTTVVPDGAAGTTLTAEQLSHLSLTVQPNSIVDANGLPVAVPEVGISPVAPAIVMDMLPAGVLQHTLDVTIQAPGGAVFTKPATLTVPNTFGLAPGAKTYVLSYDHTTGRLVIDGTATVSADGLSITSDPGADLVGPGWHGVTGPSTQSQGNTSTVCASGTGGPTANDTVNAAGDVATAWGLVDSSVSYANKNGNGLLSQAVDKVTKGGGPANYGGYAALAGNAQNFVSGTLSLKGDGDQFSQDVADYYAGDTHGNGQFDLGYKLILGSKIVGDVAQTGVDAFATTVGSIPFFNNTSIGKAGAALSYATSAAKTLGAVSSGNDPFSNISTWEEKAAAFENSAHGTGNWQRPTNYALPGAMTALDQAIAKAEADQAKRVPLYQAMVSDGTTAQSYFGTDAVGQLTGASSPPATPALQMAFRAAYTAPPTLADAAAAFERFVNDAEQLRLIGSFASDVAAVQAALQNAFAAFAADVGAPDTASSMMMNDDPSMQAPDPTPMPKPGSTYYAALTDLSDGSVQRFTFDPTVGIADVLAPNTQYTLTVYDPQTGDVGAQLVQSAASGVTTKISGFTMMPDDSAVQANGLTSVANTVLGFDGTKASNIAPGVTDAAALAQGLFDASSLVSTVGVVGAVTLQGTAQKVVVEPTGSNAAQLTAYVATGDYGLAVVDATDPRKPVVLGQIKLGKDPDSATDVAVDPTLGLAAVARGSAVDIVDVSDPTAMKVTATLPVAAKQVAIIDGTLYVPDFSTGVGVLDAYDLASGYLLDSVSLGSTASTIGMISDGTTLYLLDGNGVLTTVDAGVDQLSVLGSSRVGFGNGHMAVDGGVLYLAVAQGPTAGGYATVDVSDPIHPRLIEGPDASNIAGDAIAVNGSGKAVLVGSQVRAPNGVRPILDVVDASDPSQTGTKGNTTEIALPAGPTDVTIAGGRAYVADGADLAVVDYAPADTAGVAPTVSAAVTTSDADPEADGLQLYQGTDVALTVAVSDDVQVRSVELLVNGQSVLTDLSAPFDLTSILPTIAQNGSDQLTLQVRATDTGGNVGVSAPIPVQIVQDTRPFTLTASNPVDGALVATGARSFTFDFSRPVAAASVTAANFALIGPGGATVTPTSIQLQNGSTRVRLSYAMLPSGNFEFDLDAPSILDTTGVALGTGDILDHFSTAAYTDTWLGGASGSWSDGSRWSKGVSPGADDSALIQLDPGATVTYDAHDTSVDRLTLQGGTFDVPPPDGSGPFTIGMLTNGGRFVVEQSGSDSVDTTDAIANTGEIDLDAAAANAVMGVAGDVQLTGGGRIVLATTGAGVASLEGEATATAQNGYVAHGTLHNVDNTIVGVGQIAGQLTLDNEVGGTIQESGEGGSLKIAPVDAYAYNYGNSEDQYAGTVDNAGLIESDGGSVVIAAGTITNTGTLRSVDGGKLEIDGGNIDNTGGTISAAAGSRLVVADENGQANPDPSSGADIKSGTIALGVEATATVSGTLEGVTIAADATATASGTMALDGVTSDAAITLLDGSTLTGPIANSGTLSVAGTTSGTDTTVTVEGTMTLSGGGTLALGDSGSVLKGDYQYFTALFARPGLARTNVVAPPSDAEIDNVDNTIRGAGEIDGTLPFGDPMALVNEAQGRVDATGGTLTLDTLAITNTGTIASEAGGKLVISFTNGGSFANASSDGTTAGKLLASGGTLKIAGDEGKGGTAEVDGGDLEYGGAASDAVAFGAGAGQLLIDKIASFSGVLSGFGGSHALDLGDVTESSITGFVYQPASSGTSGSLVVTHDNGMSSSIAFSGTYTTGSFTYASDSRGGTIIKVKQG